MPITIYDYIVWYISNRLTNRLVEHIAPKIEYF